jgi:hypothetical protein
MFHEAGYGGKILVDEKSGRNCSASKTTRRRTRRQRTLGFYVINCFRRDEEYAFIPPLLCFLSAVSKLLPRKVMTQKTSFYLQTHENFVSVEKSHHSRLPFVAVMGGHKLFLDSVTLLTLTQYL